jgi:hypothetical protein
MSIPGTNTAPPRIGLLNGLRLGYVRASVISWSMLVACPAACRASRYIRYVAVQIPVTTAK